MSDGWHEVMCDDLEFQASKDKAEEKPKPDPGVDSSALLAAHTRKWSEVCEELEAMYPNANALLYVHGYVFGLRHAAAIASRTISTVVGAGTQPTENSRNASQGAANEKGQR